MRNRSDEPGDPAFDLTNLRIARLEDRVAALETGSEEIERTVDELVARSSTPKLRVVREGDDG